MSSEKAPAIRAENLTKIYAERGARSWRGRGDRGQIALDGLDFEVPTGTALGIVGRNGSGKSTLLRVISSGLRPSAGRVEVQGRIGTLLDLTSGIDPELSGEENALLLGMLAGHSRAGVQERMSEIRAFSGLGEAFDRPVRSYSAGMVLRLGFSAAIHTDPDVLLIDEALAVGDAFFAQRCLRRMRRFREEGKTIVLVSHDPSAILALCDRAIWLEAGRIAYEGAPDEVVRRYLAARYLDDCALDAPLEAAESTAADGADSDAMGEDAALESAAPLDRIDERFGDGRAQIRGVSVRDSSGREQRLLSAGSAVSIVVTAKATEDLASPIVGFTLRNRLGDVATATNSEHELRRLAPLAAGDEVTVSFDFAWPAFSSGTFSISPAIADGVIAAHAMCDWVENAIVVEGENPRALFGWLSIDAVRTRIRSVRAGHALAVDSPAAAPRSAVPAVPAVPAAEVRLLAALERPGAGALEQSQITSDRKLYVGGWAFDANGCALRIRARVGEAAWAETRADSFRDDVALNHPDVLHAGQSGFGLLVDLPCTAGPSLLHIEAATGETWVPLTQCALELPASFPGVPPSARVEPHTSRRVEPGNGTRGAARHAEVRKHLLFISHNLNLEGAPRSFLELGSSIDREAFRVSVLSPADGPLAALWKAAGFEVSVDPSMQPGVGPDDYEAAIRRIAALRSADPPDLVVANTLDAHWGIDLAQELRVPVAWIVRESESPETYFHERMPTGLAEIATACLARADRLVFVAHATRRLFDGMTDRERSAVIPNGFDLVRAAPLLDRPIESVRRELGLPAGRTLLLCVGTPCQRKGQRLLLHALAALDEAERPACVFLGARESVTLDLMRSFVDAHGLSGSVHIVAETPDPLPYYRAADVLVCPSFQESLPRSVMEGSAFGLPVIASDVNGIPEQITHEREGLLFAPGDVEGLRDAIARLCRDPASARSFGAAARARVEREFELSRSVRAFEQLFLDLVQGGSR